MTACGAVHLTAATQVGGAGTPFIQIDQICKTYPAQDGAPTRAVDNVDLSIGTAEFVSLLGPSGCGKSTLLSLVAGLTTPTSGAISIEGIAVTQPYTNIGIVFQNDLLLDWRTVLGNVLMQFEMRGQDPRVHEARARTILASVGLREFASKYPWELSGGMRQRVAICRALIHDPPLLLMDEPFGALDALTREQLQVDLQRLWHTSRKTVLFVTHSIAEAVFLSDRVVVMTPRPGRVHKVLSIDLPRPRELEVRDTDTFAMNVRYINHLFRDMGVVH